MNKRGQMTIFVIVAAVIIAAGVLVYSFYPQINSFLRAEIIAESFLKEKLEPEVRASVQTIAEQGGYENPEGYILYDGKRVKYLCYTSRYYVPCNGGVQQPMPKAKFEKELENALQEKVESAVADLKQEYLRRGYSISNVREVKTEAKIAPEKIIIDVSAPFTAEKDVAQSFQSFKIEMASKMYDLVMIATSILDYEVTYGDSSTDIYIQYYPNLRITKNKLGDGSKVYTLEDVTTNEKFTFASRSLVFPPGYGLEA